MSGCYVYILSSRSRVLYTGMTSNLERRIWEHKHHTQAGFTRRYNVGSLVYFEEHPTASQAILREKQIKGWSRAKKIALIEAMNPRWEDLSAGWFED